MEKLVLMPSMKADDTVMSAPPKGKGGFSHDPVSVAEKSSLSLISSESGYPLKQRFVG